MKKIKRIFSRGKGEESKNAARIFTEQSSSLLERLDILERQLHERIASHIPRDLDSLEHLVLQHKDWESAVHSLNRDVEEVQATFRGIALKTPAMKKNLDKVMGKWNDMQSKSQLFVERYFKKIVFTFVLDAPAMHEDLLRMQVAVSKQQVQVEQMNDDAENCRRLVEGSRAALPHSSLPRQGKHIDLERLDKEVTQLNNRWNSVCSQLAERLRSCEAAYQLLRNYNAGLEKEAEWIDDSFGKLQAMPPIEIRPKEQFEPTRNLLTSVVERTPKIEKVNVDGGRFIREAKRYAEWLCDEVHPSFDMKQLKRQAELDQAERYRSRNKNMTEQSGAEAVARELDDLNAKHQRLLDMLYERLRRIAAANPGDIVTLEALDKNIINPDSVIYNIEAGQPVTLKEAVDSGLIDKKTGKLKEPKTGKSIDVKNAAKMGLVAVVAAPVLAGMAVFQGAKALTSTIMKPKQQTAQTTEIPRQIIPEKIVKVDESQKPVIERHGVAPKSALPPKTSQLHDVTNEEIQTATSKIIITENKTEVGSKSTKVPLSTKDMPKPTYTEVVSVHGETNVPEEGRKTKDVKSETTPIKSDVPPIQKQREVPTPDKETISVRDSPKEAQKPHHAILEELSKKQNLPQEQDLKTKVDKIVSSVEKELSPEASSYIDSTAQETSITKAGPKQKLDKSDKDSRQVVQEFRQTTPDGDEITTIVKTVVTTSEPTEYVTEHSSSTVVTKSSKMTTVEITQNESTSYHVVSEEVIAPHGYSETTVESYETEFSEAPDETDKSAPKDKVVKVEAESTKPQQSATSKSKTPDSKEVSPSKDDIAPKARDLKRDIKEQNAAAKVSPVEVTVTSQEVTSTTPLEVAPGVIFDPKTAAVISIETGLPDNVFKAVDKGVIPKDAVKIIEPKTGKEITLKEAISKGVVDKNTGEVKDKSGKKISFADAAKIGLVAVVGAPILAVSKIVEVVKNTSILDPKTGNKVTLEEAQKRGLIDSETYKNYVEVRNVHTPEHGVEISEITTSEPQQLGLKGKQPYQVEEPVEQVSTTVTKLPGEVTITTTTQYGPVETQTTSSTSTVEHKIMEVVVTRHTSTEHDAKAVSAMLIDAERQPLRVIDEITEQNVTKLKSDSVKILYENIPLIDAIMQSKIEPKVCRIIINGIESPLTVQDSLEQEQISRFTPVDVISKNLVIVREMKPKYSVAISQKLTPEELSEMGVYDIEKQVFLNPKTGAKISFEELIYGLQIFDPESILVKDLTSKSDNYIPFDEAIARPIIDKTTGHMVNPKTGKRLPFLECVQVGWIVEKPEDVSVSEQLTIETALEQGLYNPKTGEIKDINTGELVPIGTAVESGLVDHESLLVRVPHSNESLPLSDAIERGIVEIRHGVITIIETQEIIEISVAIQRGLIIISRRPISIEAVITNDLYEPETGKIKDIVTEQLVTVKDAVDRNIVHPTISEIKDTKLEKFVPLSEALDTKLINPETGKIVDKKTGKHIPLDDALKKGLVATKSVTYSLFDVIELGYYSPDTCKVLDPKTGQTITLSKSIQDGLVDPSDIKIKEDKSEKVVPFEQAVKSGLIDLEKGIITAPVLNLKDASEKGYLLSDKKPWTLQEGLVQGCYDPDTGLLTINNVAMTLEDAIKIGNINPEAMTVRNSVTGEMISLSDAIKAGIIDSKEGKVRDPIQGDKISLTDASERGLIVPAKRKLSLPEAVFKGYYDPKTGKFSHPQSKEKIPTDRAIKKRMLDPQSTLVHLAGKVIPFEFAVDKGIVDGRTGSIMLGDERIDFREAFERGILVEVRKPLSLIEAIEKGVYNEITGLFMDPQSGKKYTLTEAIQLNLIDPHSVHIQDNRLGKWDKITIPESLETGVIDDKTGKIININADNEEISLRQAFEIGLLVDSKASISLQRALHQGLYDDSTGKFIDPVTTRKITLHEALRRSIISPKYLCYFDKKSEKPLTLAECCRSQIIDRTTGKFHEPCSDVRIPLSEAMSLGLIVDIESAGFTLYDALAMNLYDITELAFVHPVTERKISLKTAIVEELINPETSLIKNMPSSKYIKLDEAIKLSIVDENNSVYILPNGNKINLLDAKHRGLVVTAKKGLSLEEIIRNGLFRADNGKIVDPSTNEFMDIVKAIEIGLMNPELTIVKDSNTNKYKPLPQAIQQGDVDVTKGRVLDTKAKKTYSLDIAFDKGLLVTVVQPITSQTITKRHVSDFSAPREAMLREFTLDEAIKYEFIEPETAVIKDPHKNKYIPLRLGMTEGIIDKNAKGSFDPQSGRSRTLCFVFENGLIVYVREPLTFEQAIENGHLNINTARFTDPHSNEVLTIKDAATLGYVDPDTALIKDNLKKRLVKLPEAFRKGLMDAEKGNILDTETSKLNTLPSAIESGLLMTPKKSFSLIETLNFGIYNPTTGALNDPFITTSVMDRKRLNLGEAIHQGIVDPSSTVVKEPDTGKICPLVQAIEQKLVDPVEGRLVLDPKKGVTLDLVKALKKGYLLPAETRPLPAMLKNPFELNRECLPVRDHINDDIKNHHRLANT
ncbi:hypothetical protein MSG28_013807 [Choristoneura fumiferana]|uniref:Uncharacterized protein n=1 Tax=Choristoneura fumiferana TaxID=7141 RepID=A0ACC0K8Q7_CHOFU|nr:hypothetical protein MSG28_013807 [Choristoneura fumiferana]